jgi:hypothetical protein
MRLLPADSIFQSRHPIVSLALTGYIWLTIVLWLIFGDKTFQFATAAAIGYTWHGFKLRFSILPDSQG